MSLLLTRFGDLRRMAPLRADRWRRTLTVLACALALASPGVWRTCVVWAQGGGVVPGRIANENGQPVGEAKVSCTPETGAGPAPVLSQSDGTFAVTVPKPGAYTLTVAAGGYRTQSKRIVVKPEEAVAPVAFQLVPTSLHVALRDARTGAPLSNAVVAIRSQEDEIRDSATRRALEGGRGEYYFGRLSGGAYELSVATVGYEARTVSNVYVADRATAEQVILLSQVSTIPLGEKLRDRSFVTPRLPSNEVRAVYCAADGGVWFATARGVCRYNGQEYQSSERADSALGALAGARVNDIRGDREGTLWFATERGAYVQDAAQGRIEPVKWADGAPPSGEAREILRLCPDPTGGMWLVTTLGLMKWTEQKVSVWRSDATFGGGRINCLFFSRRNELWAGAENGLYRHQGDWTRFPLIRRDGTLISGVRDIAEDASGRLWLATASGLYSVFGETSAPVEPPSLATPLRACCVDALNAVWCAREDRGVVVYEPTRGESAEQLPGERALTLATDAEGEVWIGTQNGAVRHDVYSFVVFDTSRGLPDADIRALAADPKRNTLWIGTPRGAYEFDGVRFRLPEPLTGGVSVRALCADGDEVWIGASDGLIQWNGVEAKKVAESGLVDREVRAIVHDARRRTLWIGLANALLSFDPATKRIEGEPVMIDGELRSLMQARSGALWIATDRGAYRYDPVTAELAVIGSAQGLESLDVRCILEQPVPGRFWFATGGGIETFDGVSFQANALKAATAGTDIKSLFLDRDAFLWIGAGDGALRKFLVGGDGIAQTYRRERYGLAGSQVRAMAQTVDGKVWYATEAGLVRHIPNRIPPKVEIKLEVDGAEVKDIAATSLKSGPHRIRFEFTGVSLVGDVSYLYRFGSQNEWRTLLAERNERREFLVSNLGSGEHVFEVRALNRDLYGAASPPTRYVVWIDRPFYQRMGFWLASLTLILSGGGGVWAYQHRRAREYVLPPHLRQFKMIERNPYVVGNPIRQPAMFFGREDDFQYVSRKLEGTAQGLVIVFCGERRTGKSSILYQIMNGRLGDKFIPAFVDMQEMIVRNEAEFFQRIAHLIVESAAKRAPDASLSAPHFGAAETNPYALFQAFVAQALQNFGERQLILLVDEYELLETKVEDGKLSKEIFAFLAGLIERNDRLSMIFTGSRKLEERDKRYWREMLRRSLFRKISFLTEGDAARLVIEPVRDSVVYGRGMVAEIIRLTAGQPFYTQVICQNIVDFLNEHERNYVLRADLKVIIEEIVNNPLPQMIYFWEGLGDDEKLVLSLIAEAEADADDFVTAPHLLHVIAENAYPVTLSETTIRLTLEELFRNEILLKRGDDAFAYRIDLIRYWIKRSHSIWQVVREVKTL
jgi:ligand-binding sensor domain-containing protein/AAA+ ATPase superfamily predicted ATPase